jgi:hypothetical protein
MKAQKRLSLILFLIPVVIFLTNCQKEEAIQVTYHLEVQHAELKFRCSETEEYLNVNTQFDTSFIVYKVKNYTKASYLHYQYKFQKGIMGHVKVQLFLNSVIYDQEEVSCDRCVGKTSCLKVEI